MSIHSVSFIPDAWIVCVCRVEGNLDWCSGEIEGEFKTLDPEINEGNCDKEQRRADLLVI